MADIPKPTVVPNHAKGADRKACPRAEWLIALFWVEKAKVPEEWPGTATIVSNCLKDKAAAMRHVLRKVPCTVPGCEYCGRPQTRGVAGNTNGDMMEQTFELGGRNFKLVIHEQGTGSNVLGWLPANSRDIPRETVAEWLEEMARRVREGGK